jgi:arginyl-tRNA synthetase
LKWYESDFFDLGQQYIDIGVKSKTFREEDGAILSDLKKYALADTIVRKSDGTALYITQDLALAKLKSEKMSKDSKYIYVVGLEQTLAMKQVFAICDSLDIIPLNSFLHISYPFVMLKGKGKMSSRKGNTVYADNLIDEVKEKLKAINSEMNDTDLEKLSLSAVKFSLLKYSKNSEVNFDVDESINTTGFSGIYVMYSLVRTLSLLKDQEIQDGGFNDYELNDSERGLVMELSNFEKIVKLSCSEFSSHNLCYYLYDLANSFNKFYTECKILDEDKETKKNRLKLTFLTSDI